MKLSVIIPCFNTAATIGAQLEALAQQQTKHEWEAIVSDNGSTDGTRAIVEQFRNKLPKLRIVDSSDQKGRGHARNVAAGVADGDALLFCDADDEVAPGWLDAMAEALSQHDFVACRIDFQRLNPPWLSAIFRDHGQLHCLSKAWYPPYLFHAGGGTLGVKEPVHKTVGGFNELLWVQEDTDYCFRIQATGVKLEFVPDALLHVRCRTTLRGLFSQACVWAEYNILLYKMYRTMEKKDSIYCWRRFLRQSMSLLGSIIQIRAGKTSRAQWVWRLGWQVGTLKGTIKYQVPPL
jgi:glycosyltransferase involved in cell wall biosynthesis